MVEIYLDACGWLLRCGIAGVCFVVLCCVALCCMAGWVREVLRAGCQG